MSLGGQAVSRRLALGGLAGAVLGNAASTEAVPALPSALPSSPQPVSRDGGPAFSPTGPEADRFGAAEGFPVADPALAYHPLNPVQTKYRVGAFSHLDDMFKTRQIRRAASPWHFKRAPAEVAYTHQGARATLADYVARNPVTGLLIAQDDRILFEHYQYGRTDANRLASQSMAKSLIGLLVGVAIDEGAIRSVEDRAQAYVPGFRGTEYGKTPIRDLLHMASGVAFGEDADNGRDLNRLAFDLMGGNIGALGKAKWAPGLAALLGTAKGTVASLVQFNQRVAEPGTRYFYASIEVDVLAMVLREAVGKPVSDYLHEKLWAPMGAEADASWLVDAQGFEVAHGFFNAVLRDYARLARLLAHDGAWEGRQLIPASWMLEATTVRASDAFLAPGKKEGAPFGYGYLLWLLPGDKRQFALFGSYGQRILVDPVSKLVLVQTSVEERAEIWPLWSALVNQFRGG